MRKSLSFTTALLKPFGYKILSQYKFNFNLNTLKKGGKNSSTDVKNCLPKSVVHWAILIRTNGSSVLGDQVALTNETFVI